jgi:hypothetical protein
MDSHDLKTPSITVPNRNAQRYQRTELQWSFLERLFRYILEFISREKKQNIQVTLMIKISLQYNHPDLYAVMQNLEAKPEDFNIVPSTW